jgi:hypothetical protein
MKLLMPEAPGAAHPPKSRLATIASCLTNTASRPVAARIFVTPANTGGRPSPEPDDFIFESSPLSGILLAHDSFGRTGLDFPDAALAGQFMPPPARLPRPEFALQPGGRFTGGHGDLG